MDRCSSTQTKRHALTGAADLVKTLTSLGRATACNSRLHYPLSGREGHSLLDGWVQDAREHYGPTLETGERRGGCPPNRDDVDPRSGADPVGVAPCPPHPFGTYTEAYSHRGSRRREFSHSYLRCVTLDGEEHPRHRPTEPAHLAVP
jgi:hypothetical protein